MSSSGSLIPRFRRARRDPALAVLEGFHALKHALRFDAVLLEVIVSDEAPLEHLAGALAPDLSARLRALAQAVEPSIFAQLAPLPPPTGVIALAERRPGDPAAVLADSRAAPVVLLEDPRDLGNMGACVRVAAAADVTGVLTTGSHDPWHPDALRGAAGLHYALPVARLEGPEALGARDRPLTRPRPRGRATGSRRAARARGARVRHRALRPVERAHRARRRADQHPDGARGVQPEPRDLRGRRGVRRGGYAPVAASTPSSSSQLPRSAALARLTISSTSTWESSSCSASSSSISAPAARACSTSRNS